MAHLIKIDAVEFLTKMIEKENPDDFIFLPVSQDIKSTGENKNVYMIKWLVPNPQVLTTFIDESGFTKKYIKKYTKQLNSHNERMLLATIAKMVVVENINVVLLCSEHESWYRYLDVIGYYLDDVYGVKTCTYKQYRKNPKKYDNSDIDPKKLVKKIAKEMEEIGIEYDTGTKKKSKKKKKKK